jgi:hypothetical protein
MGQAKMQRTYTGLQACGASAISKIIVLAKAEVEERKM